MYGERGAWSRERRLASSMRNDKGGGKSAKARTNAAAGKPLRGKPCCTQKQQRLTAKHAEHGASKYSTARIHKRGTKNLSRAREATRAIDDAKIKSIATTRAQSLRSSCKVTATGRARKQPPRALLVAKHLLPARLPNGTKVKGKRTSEAHSRTRRSLSWRWGVRQSTQRTSSSVW